jgi:hypothetical protein
MELYSKNKKEEDGEKCRNKEKRVEKHKGGMLTYEKQKTD